MISQPAFRPSSINFFAAGRVRPCMTCQYSGCSMRCFSVNSPRCMSMIRIAVTDGSSCLSRLSWNGSKITVMMHSPSDRPRRLSAVARMSSIEFEIFVDFPVADMGVEASEFEPLYRREDPHEIRAQCFLEGLVTAERVERGIKRLREFFQRLVVLAGGIAGLVAQAGLALDAEEAGG